ncbi:hypothetical protein ABKN59_006486 [Abortiporus biennis]
MHNLKLMDPFNTEFDYGLKWLYEGDERDRSGWEQQRKQPTNSPLMLRSLDLTRLSFDDNWTHDYIQIFSQLFDLFQIFSTNYFLQFSATRRIVPSIKNLEERTQFLDKARDIATQYHRGSPAPTVLPQPAVVNLLTSGVDLVDFLTIVGSLPPIKLLRISATVLAGQLVNQIISSVSANDINVEHLSIFFDHDLYYLYTVNIIVDLSKFTKLTSWLMMVATIATIPVFSSSVSRISLSLCCKAQLPLEEYSVPITSNWAALLDALAKLSSWIREVSFGSVLNVCSEVNEGIE